MNKDKLKEKISELPMLDTIFVVGERQFIDTAVQVGRVYDFIDELDEPETLSPEWIAKNKKMFWDTGSKEYVTYVKESDVRKLLVPKRDSSQSSYNKGYKQAVKDAKQEKDIIPDFMGKFIRVWKGIGSSLASCYSDALKSNPSTARKEDLWILENEEKFDRAWIAYPDIEIEEEPLYYAMVKGGDLLSDDRYWNLWVEEGLLEVGSNKIHPNVVAEYMFKTTKEKWNELGINDTNADFKEVDSNG